MFFFFIISIAIAVALFRSWRQYKKISSTFLCHFEERKSNTEKIHEPMSKTAPKNKAKGLGVKTIAIEKLVVR